MNIPLWKLFLGLYLIVVGGVALFSLSFEGLQFIVGLSAILAGIVLWFFGDRALS